MISFFVRGDPVAKQRPRVTRRGTYTPIKTKNWEEEIYWEAKKHKPTKPFTKPIKLTIVVHLERPKSRPTGYYAVGRSDLDNYCKCVFDALHGDYYNNDNIVSMMYAKKIYHEVTGIRVIIESLSDEPTV